MRRNVKTLDFLVQFNRYKAKRLMNTLEIAIQISKVKRIRLIRKLDTENGSFSETFIIGVDSTK